MLIFLHNSWFMTQNGTSNPCALYFANLAVSAGEKLVIIVEQFGFIKLWHHWAVSFHQKFRKRRWHQNNVYNSVMEANLN